MERLQLSAAAVILFGIGALMVFYEWSRIKAGRPILQGSQAVQLYYVTYLTTFVLALVTALKAIIG